MLNYKILYISSYNYYIYYYKTNKFMFKMYINKMHDNSGS